jgi:hypothetical protein
MTAISYPLLDVFWTMLWFFWFFIWIWLLIYVLGDVFQSRDLSGWGKAGWVIFLIILPLLGVLVYLIFRGGSMQVRRRRQDADQQEQAFRDYVQEAASSSSPAEELVKLADLRDRGVIAPEEFEREKVVLLHLAQQEGALRRQHEEQRYLQPSGVHVEEVEDQLSTDRLADDAQTYVNVGLDVIDLPGRNRSTQPLMRGDTVWLWVEIGPRSVDAVEGQISAIEPQHLVVGQELEVVFFPDEELALTPVPAIGRFRIAPGELFPVTRRMTTTFGAGRSEDALLAHRLYARLKVPSSVGSWRIRCGVFLKGVLVHVQQLTLPVGDGALPSVRTTFRLLSRFQAPDDFASLRTPTLTIYSNAGVASHEFSFYLPDQHQAAYVKQFALDASVVESLTEVARRSLRMVSWGDDSDGIKKDSRFPQQGDGTFGSASQAADALIELAVAGGNLWLAFANRMSKDQGFHTELRERMGGMGTVQLSLKDSPDLVVPLQLLYDRRLDTSQPHFLRLCAPSAAWLEARVGDPPCLSNPCPSLMGDDPDLQVCIGGFWGVRHAISMNPAQRPCDLVSSVPSTSPPPATVAMCTDSDVTARWATHEENLRTLMSFSHTPAFTSTDVFTSMQQNRSVLLYFLAHLDYANGVPRIVMTDSQPKGALNAATVDLEDMHLCAQQPVVFINACASAAMSPQRLLGLVEAFFRSGAGGAVGTEVKVFVDLAISFAEEMLAAYTAGVALGEALRRARVEMLRLRNPLGFAYIGFGLHDLRLTIDAQ